MQSLGELLVTDEPDAVQRARRFLRAALAGEQVRPAEPAVAPDMDVAALLAAFADEPDPEPMLTVRLGAMPTDLLLSAKAHVDNVVRTATLTAREGGAGGPERHPPVVRASGRRPAACASGGCRHRSAAHSRVGPGRRGLDGDDAA